MRLFATICLFATVAPLALAQDTAAPSELKTTNEKISYAIGLNIGRQFQRQNLELDPALVARGIATVLKGQEPELDEAAIAAAFQEFEAQQAQRMEQKAAQNLEAGNAFLAANAKKEGVKVTDSGLQYKVLKEGTGQSPTPDSTVVTHYRGRFIDGRVFDNSYEGEQPTAEDEPISFKVGQVIPGWTEGLQLMKEGARYRFFIPSQIAYGPSGSAGAIPPNSTLVFDVELVEVKN